MWEAGFGMATASLLDLFDGTFARRFRRSDDGKRFGVQLDSLSDAIAFGAPPVIVGALQAGGDVSFWWMVAAAFYMLSALTRLRYYNLQTEDRGGFVELPTTLMGLIWLLLWCFHVTGLTYTVVMILGGAAMVAPLRIARPKPLLFFSVVAVAVLLAA
jgi:CDP-diacylglycerol--serine O-phosphatidyltransferase